MPRRRPPPTARELACRSHLRVSTTGGGAEAEAAEAAEAAAAAEGEEGEGGTRLALLQAHIVRRVRQQAASGGGGTLPSATTSAMESPLEMHEMHEPLPGWETRLTSASLEFRSCLLGVHVLDAEYLRLVQQLNVNQRSAESKRVMVRHPECEQALHLPLPLRLALPLTLTRCATRSVSRRCSSSCRRSTPHP